MTLTAAAELSEQRKRISARIKEQRDNLKHAQHERDLAAEKGDVTTEIKANAKAAAIEEDIKGLKATEQDVIHLLGQVTTGNGNGNGNGNGASGTTLAVFNDPDFRRELASYANKSGQFSLTLANFDPDTVASWTGRSLAAAPVAPPTPGMTEPAMTRMVPYPTPPTSFLDVVPSATTERPSTLFGQEQPATGTGPAPAAPGSVKPMIGLEYVDVEATSETIAGYLKMDRQSLDDVVGLQQMAQNRMMTLLRQELEGQVLSGDGSVSDVTGKPGLVGLLNTTGIGSVPVGSGTGWLPPDDILDAIVTLLVSGAQANIVVMNPFDWANLMKTKASGSGEYVGGGPFLSTAGQLWPGGGRPPIALVPSVAMPAGKTLVGDTTIGLALQVREGANLRVGTEVDDMTRNKVTLLCEGRWSLCVYVPAAFCVIE